MRFIKALLILLAFAAPVYAGGFSMIAGSGTVGTYCNTQVNPKDMETQTGTEAYWIGSASTLKWVSSEFLAGDNTDICKACLYTKSSSGTSPTYNTILNIYSNDATPTPDEPDSLIVNGASDTKDMTGVLTGTYQWICWTFTDKPSLLSGTIYHAVIQTSSTDGTNIIYVGKDADCGSMNTFRSSDGLSWTAIDANRCMMLRLYTN